MTYLESLRRTRELPAEIVLPGTASRSSNIGR